MKTEGAWATRYQVLAAPDAAVVDIPRGRRGRRVAAASVRAFPAGRGVVLRGSSASVHEVARAARVRIVRELIALPSATTPAYLVDDDAAPLTLLCTELLSVPPGLVRLAGPAGMLLRVGAVAARSRLARRLLHSRIAVGWRI
ncbi:MAG: hypothetical protein WAW53_15455 [Candidatus Dormiibacterota bacterium]